MLNTFTKSGSLMAKEWDKGSKVQILLPLISLMCMDKNKGTPKGSKLLSPKEKCSA